MIKRMTIMVLLLGLVLGGLFGFKFFVNMKMGEFFANRKMPPVTVEAALVEASDWQPTLAAVGTLEAFSGVVLKAEVAGVVSSVEFSSGQQVEAGALLVQVDDATEQAELSSAQAALKLAELDYQRDLKMVQQKSVAQSTLDKTRAIHEQAKAQIEVIQTRIRKKQIRAPFAGRLGLRQLERGEYLAAGQALVSLQAFDPLKLSFTLPERDLQQVSTGQAASIKVDAWPEDAFSAEVSAIDAQIDTTTRSLTIEARVPNPDGRLYPGMFADVALQLPTRTGVVRVPATAINYSLYGDSVFVINPRPAEGEKPAGLVVERRYVKTGAARDSWIEIKEGLKAGEQIVVAGQLKLDDGAAVTIAEEKTEAESN